MLLFPSSRSPEIAFVEVLGHNGSVKFAILGLGLLLAVSAVIVFLSLGYRRTLHMIDQAVRGGSHAIIGGLMIGCATALKIQPEALGWALKIGGGVLILFGLVKFFGWKTPGRRSVASNQ